MSPIMKQSFMKKKEEDEMNEMKAINPSHFVFLNGCSHHDDALTLFLVSTLFPSLLLLYSSTLLLFHSFTLSCLFIFILRWINRLSFFLRRWISKQVKCYKRLIEATENIDQLTLISRAPIIAQCILSLSSLLFSFLLIIYKSYDIIRIEWYF